MPKLDGTGPESKGKKTGRKLGLCENPKDNDSEQLGKGQGKKRQVGGGKGKGKRLKSGLDNI